MYSIRLHGLGGEGVVSLSNIIGKAAVSCGKWAHSFPLFGTAVRGAPVKAYTRVSSDPISIKSYIYNPDAIILTNDLLLEDSETLEGHKKDTILLINTRKDIETLKKLTNMEKIYPLDATSIAYEIIGKPFVNIILFGSFIAITDLLPFSSSYEIMKEIFPPKEAALNMDAIKEGYNYFKER